MGRCNYQYLLFCLGIAIFITMAILGWGKLQYGFNFIDEGMYMVDGWRLTAGDTLFPDSSISLVMLYSVLNAGIFELYPDVTLYEFRKIQFFLTLFVLIVFSCSIYKWSRQVWIAPYVFSIFAFTGLDAIGMASNLSYYTYPHLFAVLHVSFQIIAIKSAHRVYRPLLFIISGIFLWAIGFSLLPLSLGMVSPVLTWIVVKNIGTNNIKYSVKDLLLVVTPGIVLWVGFIAFYNKDLFIALSDIYRYIQEGESSGLTLNMLILAYMSVSSAFLLVYFFLFKAHKVWGAVAACLLSGLMLSIINTNLFGIIKGYWHGWFSVQLWVSSLMIVFMGIYFASMVADLFKQKKFNSDELLLVIIVIPAAIFTLLFIYISSMGILSSLHMSVLTVMGLAIFLINWLNSQGVSGRLIKNIAIAALFVPFYYNLAWADWKFTYFDKPPEYLTYEINGGFASGLKTNLYFHKLAKWIERKATDHSNKNDFIIVQNESPMVYMLAKRRPALNHSWTGWSGSRSLQDESIELMYEEGRHPRIAFRFVRTPMFMPAQNEEGKYLIAARYPFRNTEPVTKYINEHMTLTEELRFNGQVMVKMYIQKDYLK